MRMDSFMRAEFDILSYMGSLYRLHDKTVAIRNRSSDREIGAQRSRAGRESAANLFFIGKFAVFRTIPLDVTEPHCPCFQPC